MICENAGAVVFLRFSNLRSVNTLWTWYAKLLVGAHCLYKWKEVCLGVLSSHVPIGTEMAESLCSAGPVLVIGVRALQLLVEPMGRSAAVALGPVDLWRERGGGGRSCHLNPCINSKKKKKSRYCGQPPAVISRPGRITYSAASIKKSNLPKNNLPNQCWCSRNLCSFVVSHDWVQPPQNRRECLFLSFDCMEIDIGAVGRLAVVTSCTMHLV